MLVPSPRPRRYTLKVGLRPIIIMVGLNVFKMWFVGICACKLRDYDVICKRHMLFYNALSEEAR